MFLIKKYKFKNILIFTYKNNLNKDYNLEFVRYAIERYFSKYNLIIAPVTTNHINYTDKFNATVRKLKNIPEVAIFLDESLYLTYIPLFDKYDIFKNTKIITHSSGNLSVNKKYKTCFIEYNIEEMADKSVSLLNTIINKEFTNEYNIKIKSKIKNKEIFD